MTKNYVKPQIFFEEFSLNTSIAAGCDKLVKNPSENTCAVIGTGGIYMFVEAVTQCDFTESDETDDGFCYHVPTENQTLFNS